VITYCSKIIKNEPILFSETHNDLRDVIQRFLNEDSNKDFLNTSLVLFFCYTDWGTGCIKTAKFLFSMSPKYNCKYIECQKLFWKEHYESILENIIEEIQKKSNNSEMEKNKNPLTTGEKSFLADYNFNKEKTQKNLNDFFNNRVKFHVFVTTVSQDKEYDAALVHSFGLDNVPAIIGQIETAFSARSEAKNILKKILYIFDEATYFAILKEFFINFIYYYINIAYHS
jgi:hypothetical protein